MSAGWVSRRMDRDLGKCKVYFINVGYGDAIYIEHIRDDRVFNILIDGGRPENENYEGYHKRIKAVDFLKSKGVDEIDLMINTHLHEDHVGGLLDVIEEIKIKEYWCTYEVPSYLLSKQLKLQDEFNEHQYRLANAINIYNRIFTKLYRENKKIRIIDRIELDQVINGCLNLDIFGPSENSSRELKNMMQKIYESDDIAICDELMILNERLNSTSIICRIGFGESSILFMGDRGNEYFEVLSDIKNDISSSILKVGHHGDNHCVSKEFLNNVKPSVVIISVSDDKNYGCPHNESCEIIEEYFEDNQRNGKMLFTDIIEDRYGDDWLLRNPNYIEFELTQKSVIAKPK